MIGRVLMGGWSDWDSGRCPYCFAWFPTVSALMIHKREEAAMRDNDPRPTHLVAKAGDRKSICGIKDALPVKLAKFAHSANYEHLKCEQCYAHLDGQREAE